MDLNNLQEHGLGDLQKQWFPKDISKAKGHHTLFIKHSNIGKFTLLLLYVNDIIIARDDETEILALKENLQPSLR